MTTKQPRDQDDHRGRAVWLARLLSGHSQAEEEHRDGRFKANRLARAQGAELIGEFLVSSAKDEHLPDHFWSEVLDFLRDLSADLLIVIGPDEISASFVDYYRRTETLEAAGIKLAIWAVDGAQDQPGELTAA